MSDQTADATRILDIEARQEEALRALEVLELQVEQVLAQYGGGTIRTPIETAAVANDSTPSQRQAA